eukprot:jgi/Hompol1/27/HPOL_001030-RA
MRRALATATATATRLRSGFCSHKSPIYTALVPATACLPAASRFAVAATHTAVAAPKSGKLDVALIAKLRKETQCTITKAKEALAAVAASSASGDLYAAALSWLEQDLAESSAKKAAKVGDRATAEGLVVVVADAESGTHAAMVEVNSETDFVAKSPLFGELLHRIGATAASIREPAPIQGSDGLRDRVALATVPTEKLLGMNLADSPSQTVKDAFTETIGKLGENLRLRRALVGIVADSRHVFGTYAHSGGNALAPGLGRFASIVALAHSQPLAPEERVKIAQFARKIAQHITGFAPKAIHADPNATPDAIAPEEALLSQDFLFGGGSVADALAAFSAELGKQIYVADFARYACGEGLEKKADNFAEEVMKQAGL